ncbi:hypothetical protein FKM82_018224 [Ascaphus truei]
MSVWANHGAHTFRKLEPESLTQLVNCSIWQTCQILFLILGIVGNSCCFHNAAISHLVAVAKCATSLCVTLDTPWGRLPTRNSQGSRGISKLRILCSHSLIDSQIETTFGQDHSICFKSAISPHCFGQSG